MCLKIHFVITIYHVINRYNMDTGELYPAHISVEHMSIKVKCLLYIYRYSTSKKFKFTLRFLCKKE